jgi:hypothetical protein
VQAKPLPTNCLSEEGSGGISNDEVSRRFGGDVTALATGLVQQLKSVRWAAVLPSIIDAAEREPESAQLLDQLHAGQMVPCSQLLSELRGELAPGTNVSEFVASIVAPFFYRRWFTRQPLDDAFVQGGVHGLLTQLK